MTLSPFDLNDNIFRLLDKDWMLVTAGSMDHFNTMTASWGGFGILWHKEVSFIFIRPTRYTFGFTEANEYYTLSFFSDKYRKALSLLGSKSGKDVDKVKMSGLSPVPLESGSVVFKEARLIMECRKLYYQDLSPDRFLDHSIDKNYPLKDYHRMYVGEIQLIKLLNP
jgi:flavin reductase (DIM6/NTAB) family NADH-FMN oxidoreductase RutF